ncbi:MAG: UPF0182 family protein [Fimbriimonadaceae bacterium]|nr:UPF0182 family protein [Fimbriimonadaceae bacterium]
MSSHRRIVLLVAGLALLLVTTFWVCELYTDWLWYHHDAWTVVFWRRLLTKAALFVVTTSAVYAFLAVNLRYPLRYRQPLMVVDDATGDAELRAWLRGMLPLLVTWLPPLGGLVAGLALAESWQQWLPAIYGVPFGTTDPQFGLDVGFWVYRLGVLRQLIGNASTLLVLTLLATVAAYGMAEQIRLRDQELTFRRPARSHLLVLGALLLLLRAVSQWVGRYSLLIAPNRLFTGAGWTAVHVTLPALALSALLAVVAAGCCLWAIRPGRRARPAYWAVGLHVAATVVGAGLVPILLQKVRVTPNEFELETPYLERAIAATREAFAIDEATIAERALPAAGKLSTSDLAAQRATLEDIRIWDHRPLLRTFGQLQEIRQYYDIIDVDSDRYVVNGRQQQVLIAARELNHQQLDSKARSWINLHLDYTHGYGVVVSSASRAGREGQPQFLVQDIPPRAVPGLGVTQPRIYFGELIQLPTEEVPQQRGLLPQTQQQRATLRPEQIAARQRERLNSRREPDELDYLLVGTRDEFDYAENRAGQEIKHRTRYDGPAGIPVGGLLRRLALSLRLHSLELLFSDLVEPRTKLLLHRQVTRRCNKAAPFLVWDTNPYPVVIDGRVQWICEGYTFATTYPYSETHYERQATMRGISFVPTWNYLRNPVKAVVDAYDGRVQLYLVDPSDPLAATWNRVYPGLLRPASDAPAALREHFRYPVLLFKTQADMYRKYHMTDPRVFYNGEDLWAVAREVDRELERLARLQRLDPKKDELYREMEPYYITLQLPGTERSRFQLMTSFTPAGNGSKDGPQRDNLIAWMSAGCDPDDYGRLQVYRFPKDTNVYGPLQVEARIDQDDAISQQITLWDRGGSQVQRGNLLVIPVGSALLYVQPLYLESEKRGLPELKRVILAHGDRVVMEPTLAGALQRLFGDLPAQPAATPDALAPLPRQAARPSAGQADPALLARATAALEASEAALRRGDWAGYEAAREQLRAALGALSAPAAPATKR